MTAGQNNNCRITGATFYEIKESPTFQLLQKTVTDLRNEKLSQSKPQSKATIAAASFVHGLTNLIINSRVPNSKKGNKEVLDNLLNGLN